MAKSYFVPTEFHRVEELVKKSRFITSIERVSSHEEAKAFVQRMKDEFPDATHNCWAYNAGPAGDSAKVGYSDDGEPSGTAGKPMLNVLMHSVVGELAVVVTRYFGGVKLGAGGLVRAYGNAVKLGLDSLPVEEKIDRIAVVVTIPYNAVTVFKRILPEYGASEEDESYTDSVTITVKLPEENLPAFKEALINITNGDVTFS